MKVVLQVIGIVLMILAEIVGIGVAIYSFGPGGLLIGPALWAGFIYWIKFMGIGVVSFFIGLLLFNK